MAEEVKGFANLMRYCNTLEDYNQKKADGKVTDDVLVIVLEEKVAKFKGQTFDWNERVDTSSLATKEELENLANEILKNEEVSAAAFNDLNQRVDNVDISLDSELSDTSTSAVENKAIKSYVDASSANVKAYTDAEVAKKVDKVNGKQLSTEDFTSALKTKLEGLNNYDDTSIQNAVNSLTTQINTLVSGDASVAIESFNEIIAFLNGVEDSESLDSIIAAIEQHIAAKQDKISDLETIRSGAALGATALQEHQDISHLATKEELTSLTNEIIANEEVHAGAYNDLNTRLNELSENVQGETVTKEEFNAAIEGVNNGISAKQDVLVSGTNIKTFNNESILGSGNIEINVDTSALATKEELESLTNEVITNEEVSAAAFNEINDRINAISENVSGTTVTKEEFESTIETINQTINDNKSATDTAIEGLESSIGNVDAKFADYATTDSVNSAVETITNTILENEEISASAFNDINDRLQVIITRLEALEANVQS